MRFPALGLSLCLAGQAWAAEADYSQFWNGVWTAEGTLFSVVVTVAAGEVELRQVESLGFQWSGRNGRVSGAVLEIEIDYAGVAGIIEARLEGPATAIVSARSCLPDYMVICILARDRQAIFRKSDE